MKKIILSLIATTAMLMATGTPTGHVHDEYCTECVGAQGIQGEQGEQGIQGIQGIQGEQGVQGLSGANGAQGETGQAGATGTTGDTGSTGETGLSGTNGTNGTDGKDGEAGTAGQDGIDGRDFNSEGYEEAYEKVISDYQSATEYVEDVAAMSTAMAVIDFGSHSKGTTEGGIGVGTSHSYMGSAWAWAIGVKHGLTDENAVVVKGAVVNSDSYTIGAGVTHKF